MDSILEHDGVTRFDSMVDTLFDRARGNRFADRLFYAASEAGNHSLIWHGVAWARALLTGNYKQAIRISLALGLESAVVNGGIKSLFHRDRPAHDGDRPHPLRTPLTSSFPSGHATSGFFAARLLSADSKLGPAYYATALVVASSRVYVKIHHASDVVAGAALGAVMGEIATKASRRRS
jgi:undecaprenyl-diphosphatase